MRKDFSWRRQSFASCDSSFICGICWLERSLFLNPRHDLIRVLCRRLMSHSFGRFVDWFCRCDSFTRLYSRFFNHSFLGWSSHRLGGGLRRGCGSGSGCGCRCRFDLRLGFGLGLGLRFRLWEV
jgi:hypothetical protein